MAFIRVFLFLVMVCVVETVFTMMATKSVCEFAGIVPEDVGGVLFVLVVVLTSVTVVITPYVFNIITELMKY